MKKQPRAEHPFTASFAKRSRKLFRRLFANPNSNPNCIDRAFYGFEQLEDRRVLSFTVGDIPDGLRVDADSFDNVITIQRKAADPFTLIVREGAQESQVPLNKSPFRVYVYAGSGNDTLQAVLSNGSFLSFPFGGNIAPEINLSLFGEHGDDSLKGGDAADLLDGGIGKNSFDGGGGEDIGVQSADLDIVLLNNQIIVGSTGKPVSSIEAFVLMGGDSGNVIDASSFSGRVEIAGGNGNDTILGGSGSDRLDGGAGIDAIIVSGNSDISATDTDVTGLGIDQIAGFEKLSLKGGVGPNILDASKFSGDVSFDGGQGADILKAGMQANSFIASGNEGDVVVYNSGTIAGIFLDTWLGEGGQNGTYGKPSDNEKQATGSVSSQRFVDGLLYKSAETGLQKVPYNLTAAAGSKFEPTYPPVRAKLLRDFFFNGFIAERIFNGDDGMPNIKFGDTTKQMGDTLLLFAQESAILQSFGIDPSGSEAVIRIILNAFDQVEGIAEQELFGTNERGLFLRDFVNVDERHRQGIPAVYENRIESDFKSSMGAKASKGPAYTDAVMSADQSSHMMSGWWAVSQFSSSSDSVALAKDQTRRVMDYWIKVRYQLPDFDGVQVKSGRGQDARLNSGFISHMADAVTGSGYFWRPSNVVNLGYIDNQEIINGVRNVVRGYVDLATVGLSAAARKLFDWDPVGDVFNAIRDKVPERTAINLPVSVVHNLFLTISDITVVSQLFEVAFTGEVSLNLFIPTPLRAVFDRVSFDVPTSFDPGGQECLKETKVQDLPGDDFDIITCTEFKVRPPKLETKTVSLSSLIGEIKFRLFPNGSPIPPFARSLGLLMMAFDPDLLRVGAKFQDLAMADQNASKPGDQPNVWVAMLRPAVQPLEDVSPEVVTSAKSIASTASPSGSRSDDPNGWSSKNRWETATATEDTNGHVTSYNGVDFLSLDTLIRSRNLSSSAFGGKAGAVLVPNADDPSLLDLRVLGTNQSDNITLVARAGDAVEVFLNNVSEGVFIPTGEIFVSARDGEDTLVLDGIMPKRTSVFGDGNNDKFLLKNGAGANNIVEGGAGTDTIVGDDRNTIWTIQQGNRGKSDLGTEIGTVENFVGGNLNDNYVFEDGATVVGAIDGKGGFDELNFSATSSQIITLSGFGSLDGYSGNASVISKSFENFEKVIGSNSQLGDRLIGLNLNADWYLLRNDSSYAPSVGNRTLFFGNVEILDGGDQIDNFYVRQVGSKTKLNGNNGDDLFEISSNAGTSRPGHVEEIGGILTIDAGAGNGNRVKVDDYLSLENASVRMNASSIIGIAPNTIEFFATGGVIDTLLVQGANTGSDLVLVTETAVGRATKIFGGGGNDTFSVGSDVQADNGNLDSIGGALELFGGGASDRVYINDHGKQGRVNYKVDPRSVIDLPQGQVRFPWDEIPSRSGFAGVFYDKSMESLQIDANDATNVFDVQPSTNTAIEIGGNSPIAEARTTRSGDYLYLNRVTDPLKDPDQIVLGRITFTSIVDGRQRAGIWQFDSVHQPIAFANIERFNLLDKLTVSSDAAWTSSSGVGVNSPVINAKYSSFVTNFTSLDLVPFSPSEFPSPTVVGKDMLSNFLIPSDVNNDGNVSPLDALVVINHLNRRSSGGLGSSSGFLDVNNDGIISPLDALIVINTLNRDARPSVTFGGVRTTSADLNFDGVDEVIAVSGANHIPALLVFNGVTGQLMGSPQPLTTTADNFGANVTAGDIDGDGEVEIITSLDRGPGIYSIWRWENGLISKIADRTVAFSTGYLGGVRVATGDLNGDGKSEIIVGSGTGADASVRAYDANGAQLSSFLVAPSFGRGGVYVATGDYNGDGRSDLFVSSGRRGNSQIQVFDGVASLGNSIASSRLISNAYAGQDAIAPISIALKDSDGDEEKELYSSQLSDGKSDQLKKWEYSKAADAFFSTLQSELDPNWSSGAYLG